VADEKLIRLGQASRKLNVGHNTILEFLAKKGFTVENNPNAKLTPEQFAMLSKEYASSASEKLEASSLSIGAKHPETVTIGTEAEAHRKKIEEEERIMITNLGSKEIKFKEETKPEKVEREKPKLEGIKVLGKIELEKEKKKTEAQPEISVKEETKAEPVAEKQPEQELIKAKANRLQGLKVVDRIELPAEKKKDQPVASSDIRNEQKKRPRKRIVSPNENNRSAGPGQKRALPQSPPKKKSRTKSAPPWLN